MKSVQIANNHEKKKASTIRRSAALKGGKNGSAEKGGQKVERKAVN